MRKKNKLILIYLSLATLLNAEVNLNGTAILNSPSFADGQVGVYVVNTTGGDHTSFTDGTLSSLDSGVSIFDSSIYDGFTYAGTNTVSSGFGVSFGGISNISLAGDIDEGDHFGILIFDRSTTTTIDSDTYQIWSDSTWIIPADGNDDTFGTGSFLQFSNAPSLASGTVVPETSTYAFFAGVLILSYSVIRRSHMNG